MIARFRMEQFFRVLHVDRCNVQLFGVLSLLFIIFSVLLVISSF